MTDLTTVRASDFAPAGYTVAAVNAAWTKALNRCAAIDAAMRECSAAIRLAKATPSPVNRQAGEAALHRQHDLNRARTTMVSIANGLSKRVADAVADER